MAVDPTIPLLEATIRKIVMERDDLRRAVSEALQDGPFLTDRDGYSWCWFCGGEGAWEKEKVEHEADCVYLTLVSLIDGEAT